MTTVELVQVVKESRFIDKRRNEALVPALRNQRLSLLPAFVGLPGSALVRQPRRVNYANFPCERRLSFDVTSLCRQYRVSVLFGAPDHEVKAPW